LLTKDSTKRLGTGPRGSDNDINAIKSHPFFTGIDWNNLHTQKPPIDKLFYNPKPIQKYTSFSPKSRRNATTKPNSDLSIIDLLALDTDEDTIIFECIIYFNSALVKKKSPWLHYDTRILRLLSNSTLEYLDPNSLVIKGIIKLDEYCKAVLKDEYKFELYTTRRTFIFLVYKF
jgi:hypothetical protein